MQYSDQLSEMLSAATLSHTGSLIPIKSFQFAQAKATPEHLNFHEVIHSKAYQKLRFDVDAPMEFLEQVLPDYKKPKLKAKPIKLTGDDLLDA